MRLALALLLVLSVPSVVPAQDGGPSRWQGQWTNPRGHLFAADAQLEFRPDGTVQGTITWTLVKSPRPGEQAKLGQKGVEHVRGRYDARCRLLSLEGHSKDDPNTVIGLDVYRLVLTENGKALVGPTRSHREWEGRFEATRVLGDEDQISPRR